MNGTKARWDDQRIETTIGNLLRAGVVLAACVTFIGGFLYLAQAGSTAPQYRTLHGEPVQFRNVKAIICAAISGNGWAVMQFGLVLLIATPVARVAFSLFAFAIQHDRLYVLVTSVVLVILCYSMLGGRLCQP